MIFLYLFRHGCRPWPGHDGCSFVTCSFALLASSRSGQAAGAELRSNAGGGLLGWKHVRMDSMRTLIQRMVLPVSFLWHSLGTTSLWSSLWQPSRFWLLPCTQSLSTLSESARRPSHCHHQFLILHPLSMHLNRPFHHSHLLCCLLK